MQKSGVDRKAMIKIDFAEVGLLNKISHRYCTIAPFISSCEQVKIDNRMRYILTFILLISSFISLSQTCIIGIKTNDEIIFAADTKSARDTFIMVNDTFLRKTFSKEKLKIIECGSKYYSISGYATDSINTILNAALKKFPQINEALDSLVNKVVNLYKDALGAMKRENIETTKQLFKNGNISVMAFYGFENRVPVVKYISFNIPPTLILDSVTFRYEYPILCLDSIEILIMGHNSAFVSLSDSYLCSIISYSKNKEILLAELIEKQIVETPIYVGKPIDIISITNQGSKWIRIK